MCYGAFDDKIEGYIATGIVIMAKEVDKLRREEHKAEKLREKAEKAEKRRYQVIKKMVDKAALNKIQELQRENTALKAKAANTDILKKGHNISWGRKGTPFSEEVQRSCADLERKFPRVSPMWVWMKCTKTRKLPRFYKIIKI